MGMRPGWVGALVEESFFVGCPAHENRKKNEKNIFCLGCCASICTHCLPAHRHHPLIQVRNLYLRCLILFNLFRLSLLPRRILLAAFLMLLHNIFLLDLMART
jgi:hypothetical protein